MADGAGRPRPRVVAALPGPAPATLARLDQLLGLLALAGAPCQTARIQLAMGWTDHQTRVTDLAGKRGLTYQAGSGHSVGWALSEDGVAASKPHLASVTGRQAEIASGRVRVCPTCSVEHLEDEAGVDRRKLRGRADVCDRCMPKPVGPTVSRGSLPLRPAEVRMLGFLAAHPWRRAVEQAQHAEAVRQLGQRFYVEAETVRFDGGARLNRPLVLVKVTRSGSLIAAELGLVCPGRESGECEECSEAMARVSGKV
jgi:hypothetical protein